MAATSAKEYDTQLRHLKEGIVLYCKSVVVISEILQNNELGSYGL